MDYEDEIDSVDEDMAYYPSLSRTPLHQKLLNFQNEEKYCDVKIRVQNKTFNCHRVVLASASEYFDAMFGGYFMEKSSEVITLQDIDAVIFQTIIEAIYNDCEPPVNADNVCSLMKTGQFLGMSDVVMTCENFIENNIEALSIDVFKILNLVSICSSNLYLKNELKSYILRRFNTFIKQDTFLEMLYDDLNELLKEYRAASTSLFKNENFLLDALIRWVHYSRKERTRYLQKLVEMVDFGKVSATCEDFIFKEYQISFEKVEECPDGRAVKRVRIEPFGERKECTIDQMLRLLSFEDPQFSEDSSTIHLIMMVPFDDERLRWYNIISLDNHKVKHDWFKSRKFSKPSILHSFTPLGNNVYCFDEKLLGKSKPSFVAYSSVDFSLEPSNTLASISVHCPKMCGLNNEIYLNQCYILNDDSLPEGFSQEEFERGFYCYKCDVNRWLPVPENNRSFRSLYSCLIADDTLIYLIGKRSFAYDPRSPAWITLPDATSMSYHGPGLAYDTFGCAINGQIYICEKYGASIETLDPTAGKWKTELEGGSPLINIIPYENKLYIFMADCQWGTTFCVYNPTSKEMSSIGSTNVSVVSSFESIVFKSLEL